MLPDFQAVIDRGVRGALSRDGDHVFARKRGDQVVADTILGVACGERAAIGPGECVESGASDRIRQPLDRDLVAGVGEERVDVGRQTRRECSVQDRVRGQRVGRGVDDPELVRLRSARVIIDKQRVEPRPDRLGECEGTAVVAFVNTQKIIVAR